MRRLYVPEKTIIYTDENGMVYAVAATGSHFARLCIRDVDGEQVSFTDQDLRELFRVLKKHGWEEDKPND